MHVWSYIIKERDMKANTAVIEGHGGLICEGFGGLRIGDGGTQI